MMSRIRPVGLSLCFLVSATARSIRSKAGTRSWRLSLIHIYFMAEMNGGRFFARMSKSRRNTSFLPLDDTLFAVKPRKPVPHEFVLDAIATLSPKTRSMFGCLAIYVQDKIVPVSYTHLDVYKRQVEHHAPLCVVNVTLLGLDGKERTFLEPLLAAGAQVVIHLKH